MNTNITKQTAHKQTGGGYSIGPRRSYDGNTMVRQNSTDDEEEDPFQGQTMDRAPTIPSPRTNLLSEDVMCPNLILSHFQVFLFWHVLCFLVVKIGF